jgi:succinyl-CoA synthetase alpha subunit
MSILLDADSRIAIHGIRGRYGTQQLATMRTAGTNIVAGISPGSGGERLDGIPLFDTLPQATSATGADAVLLYVPAAGVLDAVIESVAAGVRLIVAAAEHVPVHDTLQAAAIARSAGAWLVGPNSLGLTIPGVGMMGSYSTEFAKPGPVGLISRSGSLSVTASRRLAQAGLGQSAVIHLGGDYICGRNPGEYLPLFEADPDTEVIAYVGEVGGTKEYDLVCALEGIRKPVVALIVGRAALPGKRLGHAGALVVGERDTAHAKREALWVAGVHLADGMPQLAALCRSLVSSAKAGVLALGNVAP